MPQPNTFTLTPPKSKPVEIVLIEREDGTVVARTAAELAAAAAAPEAAPRG
jgi:hypothetical protein